MSYRVLVTRRYSKTSIFNREPWTLLNILTAEQFLENHLDLWLDFAIHPYVALPPQKSLRTTSYHHNSLIPSSSILMMLRNCVPLSFNEKPHWSLQSDIPHRIISDDEEEPSTLYSAAEPSLLSPSQTSSLCKTIGSLTPPILSKHTLSAVILLDTHLFGR